jgi:pimeloyl-ACP methyl ester carboxylesterase
VTFHQTKWSDEEGGRVYRHDVRALQAFRDDAQASLDQWNLWKKVRCPVLLIHGMMSDALLPPTIRRMREETKSIAIMHVPDTGHTPVLSDRNQNWFIHEWLMDHTSAQRVDGAACEAARGACRQAGGAAREDAKTAA